MVPLTQDATGMPRLAGKGHNELVIGKASNKIYISHIHTILILTYLSILNEEVPFHIHT